MNTQEFISIAVDAGYEITEYDDHYCIKHNLNFEIVVTIPKVINLVSPLLQKIKDILGL